MKGHRPKEGFARITSHDEKPRCHSHHAREERNMLRLYAALVAAAIAGLTMAVTFPALGASF